MKVRRVTCADYENCLRGAGAPFYAGGIGQRGHGLGGLFRGIASTILPLLPKLGKSLLKTAGATALGVVSDKLKGIPLSRSIKQRGLEESKALLQRVVERSSRKARKRPGKKKNTKIRASKRRKDVFGQI